MSDRWKKSFLIGLPVLTVTIIAIFLTISFTTNDPYWLNRGGALVAACSAGALIIQIVLEIGIERRRHELEIARGETEESSLSPVLETLAEGINERKTQQESSELIREQLQIAAIVVVC